MDAVAAQNFYGSKAYDFAAMIVAKNPNVLVKIDGTGQRAADLVWLFGEEFNLQLDKKGEIHATLFGAQASSFLQGYGEFKDADAAAQNSGQTQKSNPNCIMNAVRGSTGLARPFGDVGPSGIIGHDGIHVVAPRGSRVTTLSPLTGTVLGVHDADEGRTHIVDVLLDRGGFVALYKDLVTVNVRRGQHLSVGATIGTIGAYEGGGLHFALLNGGRQADNYYRSLTSTDQRNKITVGMFTNPNGPNSPVNCPGVPVNNAGVNPHP